MDYDIWFPTSITLRDERYVITAEDFDTDHKWEFQHIVCDLSKHVCLDHYLTRALFHEEL